MVALASACAQAAIAGLMATVRAKVVGAAHLEALRREGRPILFTVWHGRLLLPLYAHRQQEIVAMVSLSRDGDLAAATLQRLGYGVVRGSSSRGGRDAFLALRDRLLSGSDGAIIPDGPRGPARELKTGILYLAQETDASILPISWSASPARLLASWDRFLLPSPFARAVLVYGEPLVVPRAASPVALLAMRDALAARLSALEAEADAQLGKHAPGAGRERR